MALRYNATKATKFFGLVNSALYEKTIMSNIIEFPSNKRDVQVQIERAIEAALINVKPEYKDRLKQEGLNAFKEHESIFSDIKLDLPDTISEEQISNLKKAFEEEKEKKYLLVAKIMSLKISNEINNIEKESRQ